MKTNFYKSSLIALLMAGALTGCVNDDDYSVPNSDCIETTLVANIEPQDIVASPTVQLYEGGNDVIEAYVVSSDEGGNFFKTISFQTLDGSFGFSVPVDATGTFVEFEPGRKVLITLEGQYVDIANNSLRIGSIFVDTDGDAQVGRIPVTQYRNVLHRSCQVVNEDELVRELTISEAKNDANLNTLIELQNVQFTDGSLGTNYYDPSNDLGGATNHYLTDSSGNTIIFRTSSFANFAGSPVSDKSGTVRGVLTKFGSDYQFMARTEDDIKLTETPVPPLYQEDFQDIQHSTNLDIEGWVNYNEEGNWKWRERIHLGNGYAEFSSYGSGSASNVAWLVSPAINLDGITSEEISFRIAQHHLDVDSEGNKLEIYIFTDFDGTDVLGATMVEITDLANIPTMETEWYEFLTSNIDVSSYSGNIYVAFKFTGSGTDTTLDGAFQVDDLKLTGTPE